MYARRTNACMCLVPVHACVSYQRMHVSRTGACICLVPTHVYASLDYVPRQKLEPESLVLNISRSVTPHTDSQRVCALFFQVPKMVFEIGESTMVRNTRNQITVVIWNVLNTQGITPNETDKRIMQPLIVTISGLTGTDTPSDSEFELDSCHGPTAWDGRCLVGLGPAQNSLLWRTGIAKWDQDAGTVSFTVLGKINAFSASEVYGDQPLTIKFTVDNGHAAQPKVTTSIQSCTGTNKWSTCASPSAPCQKVCICICIRICIYTYANVGLVLVQLYKACMRRQLPCVRGCVHVHVFLYTLCMHMYTYMHIYLCKCRSCTGPII
jgi:hypothetical protein